MPRGGAPDVVGATTGVPGGNIQNLADEYKEWATDYMGSPSGANSSSVLATFLVDRGLDQGPTADHIMKDMAREMRFDIVDVRRAVGTAREEHDAGGTMSDQEIHDRSFKEGKMMITKRQLKRIIKEEKTKLLNEAEQHVVLSAWDQAIGNVEAVEKELYGLTDPGARPGELPFGDELGKQLAAAIVELNQAYEALELHFDDESGRNPGGSIG